MVIDGNHAILSIRVDYKCVRQLDVLTSPVASGVEIMSPVLEPFGSRADIF